MHDTGFPRADVENDFLRARRRQVLHGDMWAKAGHVPSIPQLTSSEVFKSLEYRSDYAASANYVAYWPRNAKQWTINEKIINEFERMIYGYQSPQEALNAAVQKINSELSE